MFSMVALTPSLQMKVAATTIFATPAARAAPTQRAFRPESRPTAPALQDVIERNGLDAAGQARGQEEGAWPPVTSSSRDAPQPDQG